MGAIIPRARAATVQARPRTVSFQPVKWRRVCNTPNSMAKAINNKEMVPAAPLVSAAADRLVTPSTVW